MGNHIVRLELRDGLIEPFAAEVWVRAEVERAAPTAELRGRLVGPLCRFATTIEVAHLLQSFIKKPTGFTGLSGRIVIPEMSLWDPQSPFLYRGAIELWQDDQLCQRLPVSHGLRTLTLSPRGLFINGRRLYLRGREVTTLTEEEALGLRAAGVNLLVAPVTGTTASLWDLADRIGFLMLGRITALDAETPALFAALATHASCLGWLRDSAEMAPLPVGGIIGMTVTRRPSLPLPEGVQFLLGAADLADLGVPLLVHGDTASEVPGILGMVAPGQHAE